MLNTLQFMITNLMNINLLNDARRFRFSVNMHSEKGIKVNR